MCIVIELPGIAFFVRAVAKAELQDFSTAWPCYNHAVTCLVGTVLARSFFSVSLALVSASALAQSPADFSAIQAREKACEVADQTVVGSGFCEKAAYVAADRKLNELYTQIMNKIKQSEDEPLRSQILQRLISAERAWVVFRDAECTYESSVAINAPLEGYEYHACRYEKTKARVKALADPAMPQNAR